MQKRSTKYLQFVKYRKFYNFELLTVIFFKKFINLILKRANLALESSDILSFVVVLSKKCWFITKKIIYRKKNFLERKRFF